MRPLMAVALAGAVLFQSAGVRPVTVLAAQPAGPSPAGTTAGQSAIARPPATPTTELRSATATSQPIPTASPSASAGALGASTGTLNTPPLARPVDIAST